MSRNIKEIGKELLGKSLNSYHRRTGLTQLEKNNEMQDGILNGILSQVDNAYIEKTEQSNVIHLEGSGDGVVVVDSIEGNTMVNLLDRDKMKVHLVTAGTGENLIQYNNGLKITSTLHERSNTYCFKCKFLLDKSLNGRKFIVSFTNPLPNRIRMCIYNNTVGKIEYDYTDRNPMNIELPNDDAIRYIYFDLGNGGVGETSQATYIIDNIMFLSDYDINNEIPQYFEGLQSSFEEYKEEDKYKIEILSRCSNLINTISNAHEIKPIYSYYGDKLNEIKPYLKYFNLIDSYNNCNNLYDYYYTDGGLNIWINLGTKDKYKALEVLNKRIAEGMNKSNKIKLLINEPLRAIGDVKDRLCIKDNKLVVERNCGSDVLNGEEGWNGMSYGGLTSETRPNTLYFYKYIDNLLGDVAILSDKFANVLGIYSKDTEGIHAVDHNLNNLRISINKSKLLSESLVGFKQWLSENFISIIYQLAEPYYEEVLNEYGEPIILEGYENGTLYIDSIITPTTTVRYTPKMESFNTLKEVESDNNLLTDDINDNIIPYMMDVDLMIMEKEMDLISSFNKNIRTMEVLDMTSMQKRTQQMLERLIKGKTLSEQECQTRVTTYLNAGKITDEQAEELMLLISEVYA